MELAALAYKIYNEKINPVIYINGDNLCFASQSSEIQVLDELMQEVEQVGDKDTRFLIVWDSSSYRNVVAEAKQLVHELENRGRRFVLVCSAYTSVESKKKEANKVYYTLQHDGSFVKSEVRQVYTNVRKPLYTLKLAVNLLYCFQCFICIILSNIILNRFQVLCH